MINKEPELTEILRVENLSKSFGGKFANEDVSLSYKVGTIYAMLGENGAGKSTLMNMISGLITPDHGKIFMENKQVSFSTPKDAINHGIVMVHQHFQLVDDFTALENILLGNITSFFKSEKKEFIRMQNKCHELGFSIDLHKKIIDMSVSEKQTVEILKSLIRDPKILILDEPTAVLTNNEINTLFKTLNKLKQSGCCIVIITHKMHEVFRIADELYVLRKGRMVTGSHVKGASEKDIAEAMVGKAVDLNIACPDYNNKNKDKNDDILKISDLSVLSDNGSLGLDKLNFQLKSGEILGVAGIAGSGQKELCEAILGIRPVESGNIRYNDETLLGKTPREISHMGVGLSFVPEDRLGMGLVPTFNIPDNLLLKSYHTQQGLFLKRKSSQTLAHKIIKDLEVTPNDINYPVKNFSGGNIQKVLLGRELSTSPHILVVAYPARGLDIASSQLIYGMLNEQKKKGVGILFIGEDIDVLSAISDRLMIMCDAQEMGTIDPTQYKKEDIGMMISGTHISELTIKELTRTQAHTRNTQKRNIT